MTGRLENELKIQNLILLNLKSMPEFMTEWYNHLLASSKEASSCNDFINKTRRFLFFINKDNIKNILPSDITLEKVEEYFVLIQTRKTENGEIVKTSDSYKQGIWFALNNFFDFMHKRNYISQNYMNYITKPKNKDIQRINEHRVLLTKNDFNNILDSVINGVGSNKAKAHQNNMKYRDLSIMVLFMQTGMRRTALSEINIEDIDFNKRELYVIDKGDKRHVYHLTDQLIEYLTKWIYQRNKILENDTNNALFITSNKKRISGSELYNIVTKYCEESTGKKISPHKLRSGFCSILYNETGDAEFVRRAVGHSNIATTQRYIVTNNSEKQIASEMISQCLFE